MLIDGKHNGHFAALTMPFKSDKYEESPVLFVLTPRFQYYKVLDCQCLSCVYNINYRSNMSYIPYHGTKCYPIFPCLKEDDNMYKYDVDKMLEAMTILQNFEIPENLVFYLQRETFGFQLILDALQEINLIHFDDYGDVVDFDSTPVNGKNFKRYTFKNAIVIDSSSLAYTFPRIEYNYVETHINSEMNNEDRKIKEGQYCDLKDKYGNVESPSKLLEVEKSNLIDKCRNAENSSEIEKFNIECDDFEPETFIYGKKMLYPSCSLWSLNISNENICRRHKSNILDRHIGPKPMVKQKLADIVQKEN